MDWLVGISLFAVGAASATAITSAIHHQQRLAEEAKRRAEDAALVGEMLRSIGAARLIISEVLDRMKP